MGASNWRESATQVRVDCVAERFRVRSEDSMGWGE